MTEERAQIDGLETTAEERAKWGITNYVKTVPGDSDLLWHRVERLCRDHDRLAALLAEARAAIAWANNSLYGAHGFFLSLDGAPADVHHLDRAIEVLKEQARRPYKDHLAKLADSRAREARAREEERAKCAEVADHIGDADKDDNLINDHLRWVQGWEQASRRVAQAIRARGDA